MDIEKIAKAVEDDAGRPVEGLRESLKEMRDGKTSRKHTPEQIILRSTRRKLELSQPEFAEIINTPVATLRDWEQGRSNPSGSAVVLCKIFTKHPEIIGEVAGCE